MDNKHLHHNLLSQHFKTVKQLSELIYRTEKGTLYGTSIDLFCVDIFYTHHCLVRFKERTPSYLCAIVERKFKEVYNFRPTIVDIINYLIKSNNKEYGLWKDTMFLNIGLGALVLKDMDNVFIVKTFLTPDLLHAVEWYKFKEGIFYSFQRGKTIKKPSFFIDKLAENLGHKLLSHPSFTMNETAAEIVSSSIITDMLSDE